MRHGIGLKIRHRLSLVRRRRGVPSHLVVFLAIALGASVPVRLYAGPDESENGQQDEVEICDVDDPAHLTWEIPLNSTGIGDLRFINPREPFDWLARAQAAQNWTDEEAAKRYKLCLPELRLIFRNETSSRSFLVTFPFKIKTARALTAELTAAVEQLYQTLLAVRADDDLLNLADSLLAALAAPTKAGNSGRQVESEWDRNGPSECDTCRARQLAESAIEMGFALAISQGTRLKALVETIEQTRRREEELLAAAQQCQKPGASGVKTCSLQIGVPAGVPQPVNRQQWRAIIASADQVIKFTVAFFDEEGTPSNATGYVAAVRDPEEEASKTSWTLVASIGASRDPEASRKNAAGETLKFTVDDRYDGGERRRFPASGRLSLLKTYNSLAKASVDFTFKAGDLGESDTTRELEATKYDITAYGTRGFAVRGGRFALAAPSDRLAISESGEGFQLVLNQFNNLSLGHLVKRESLEGASNDADLDSDVTILQGQNVPFKIKELEFLTTADFSLLYGRENKKDQTPYDYTTVGGEIRFAWAPGLKKARESDFAAWKEKQKQEQESTRGVETRVSAAVRCCEVCPNISCDQEGPDREALSSEARAPAGEAATVTDQAEQETVTTKYHWPFSGSLAAYVSKREQRKRTLVTTTPEPGAEPTEVTEIPEGSGTVGLLTLKWARVRIDSKSGNGPGEFLKTKVERSFRFRLGRGSGDDPGSEKNEGYLGETAGFAPDKLFLKSLATNLDSGGMGQIGPGLSNKAYAEFTYTDYTWSIFRRLALFLTKVAPDEIKHPKDDPIVNQSTVFRAHSYRFDEPVLGSHDAGFELGLDFEIQVPKGVKATLGLGKFFPGEALDPLFASDPYVVSFTASVTMQ